MPSEEKLQCRFPSPSKIERKTWRIRPPIFPRSSLVRRWWPPENQEVEPDMPKSWPLSRPASIASHCRQQSTSKFLTKASRWRRWSKIFFPRLSDSIERCRWCPEWLNIRSNPWQCCRFLSSFLIFVQLDFQNELFRLSSLCFRIENVSEKAGIKYLSGCVNNN